MISFSEFINESFDKPLPWKWDQDMDKASKISDKTLRNSTFSFNALFTADGFRYNVLFVSYPKSETFEVEFYPMDQMEYTNNDLGFKVLSTVLDIIEDFVKKMDPNHLAFHAEKAELVDDQLDRASVYKRMIKRFLPSNYDVRIYDQDDIINFEITKKR